MSDWPTRRLVNVMDQPSTAPADLDALIARLREVLGLAESAPGWEWPVGAILLEKTVTALAAFRAENRRLRESILWALGYLDFPDKPTGKGRYWWRTELAQRAAIGDDAAREEKT